MQSKCAPGRPPTSTAPQKQPQKIAPAKLAAMFWVEVAKQKEARLAQKRKARLTAVIEYLEALAEAQRKKKARSSALDPIKDVPIPMQETKGKVKNKKNKLVQLLQLSALGVMSHLFGAPLASWMTGVAVDCEPEWARRETVDIPWPEGHTPRPLRLRLLPWYTKISTIR